MELPFELIYTSKVLDRNEGSEMRDEKDYFQVKIIILGGECTWEK